MTTPVPDTRSLIYNDIAYIPMTYDLCRFPWPYYYWDADSNTFSLRVSNKRGEYVLDTRHKHKSETLSISRVSCSVSVNGTPPFSCGDAYYKQEQFPMGSYNDVVYFHFTFLHAQSFHWYCPWEPVPGLNITLTREVNQNLLDWETNFIGTPLE